MYPIRCLLIILLPVQLLGQDLDPRAYVRGPKGATVATAVFSYSKGSVVTDATLPLQDVKASVEVASVGVVHTFSFFGLSSQAFVALPYSWAQASATVNGVQEHVTRSGLADMRVRWSVLLVGAPAATLEEVKKAPRRTIVGLSINGVLPTGQNFPDKLINLGTRRVSVRPELGISQPIGRRWMLDVYAGAWFFSANNHFYPGSSTRTQEPMGSFQAHLSYNVNPQCWVALDGTYYTGGQSAVDRIYKDDRQKNSRIGFTAVLPAGKRNSIKLAASTGAVIRVGQDFTTLALGWQHSWLGRTSQK